MHRPEFPRPVHELKPFGAGARPLSETPPGAVNAGPAPCRAEPDRAFRYMRRSWSLYTPADGRRAWAVKVRPAGTGVFQHDAVVLKNTGKSTGSRSGLRLRGGSPLALDELRGWQLIQVLGLLVNGPCHGRLLFRAS